MTIQMVSAPIEDALDEAIEKASTPPARCLYGLDAGVAVERIGAAADIPAHGVLKEPVDEDHVTSSQLFAPAHLLLHHLGYYPN